MPAGWCCEGGLAGSGWGLDRCCLVPVRTCWLLVEDLRCRRWRFFENVDASKERASVGRSRNHLNNMS